MGVGLSFAGRKLSSYVCRLTAPETMTRHHDAMGSRPKILFAVLIIMFASCVRIRAFSSVPPSHDWTIRRGDCAFGLVEYRFTPGRTPPDRTPYTFICYGRGCFRVPFRIHTVAATLGGIPLLAIAGLVYFCRHHDNAV